jgi:hypothetical protein
LTLLRNRPKFGNCPLVMGTVSKDDVLVCKHLDLTLGWATMWSTPLRNCRVKLPSAFCINVLACHSAKGLFCA